MNQLGLIIISILFGATGQVLLKAGANRLDGLNLSLSKLVPSIISILKTPAIIIGMITFAISSLLWIKVLTKAELSYAYPMVSFSYVIVAIAAAIFFKEAITLNKIIGIAAIVMGVFILNR
jgi:drug/metabolite transporter (DMT)-like permease